MTPQPFTVYDSTTCATPSSPNWPRWAWPTTSWNQSPATCRAGCLEHHSHIPIDAKRVALDALDVQRSRVLPVANNGHGPETEPIVEISDELPSQSRHSLTLSGSPPHGKLLIPFERRDVRVVEGARLESVCTRNCTKGSNPFLSASLRRLILGGSG